MCPAGKTNLSVYYHTTRSTNGTPARVTERNRTIQVVLNPEQSAEHSHILVMRYLERYEVRLAAFGSVTSQDMYCAFICRHRISTFSLSARILTDQLRCNAIAAHPQRELRRYASTSFRHRVTRNRFDNASRAILFSPARLHK